MKNDFLWDGEEARIPEVNLSLEKNNNKELDYESSERSVMAKLSELSLGMSDR